MSAPDLVTGAYTLLYIALALRALLDWRRGDRNSEASLWFAQIFLALAPASIATLASEITGTTVDGAIAGLLLLPVVYYPYALFRFVTYLRPVPRRATQLATASTGVLLVWLLVLVPSVRLDGTRTPAVQIYVYIESLQWLALTVVSVVLLWRASAGQPDVVRLRLRSLATAATLLSAANVLRAGSQEESLQAAWSMLTLVAAIAFAAGYAPPSYLREFWNRRDRSALPLALVAILGADSVDEIGEMLLPSVTAIVGGTGSAMIDRDGSVLATYDFDEARATRVLHELESASREREHSFIMIGNVACCALGDRWVLVGINTYTPMFGTDELELLESVMSTSALALDRLHALDDLRERESQLANAQRMAGVGSFQWFPKTSEMLWSPELFPILGLDPSDTPMSADELLKRMSPIDRDRVRQALRDAIELGTAFAVDHEIELHDGTTKMLHTRGMAIRDADPVYVEGTVQDVTDRKLVELALRDAYQREREASEQLRSLDRMKDGILVAVSHELRTPLTSILGFVLTMRDRGETLEPDVRTAMLQHMVEQSQKLDRLLTDLLDVNRLRRGVIAPVASETDVAQLVRDCAESLSIESARLNLDLDEGTNQLDPAMTERIIDNLLSNASKYGPDGGTIGVVVRRSEAEVDIVVHDDGPGIPPDERASVFEPFHRSPDTSNLPGTGVGLSLVAEYARLHAGEAWIEAGAGGTGTSVHVRLRDLAQLVG